MIGIRLGRTRHVRSVIFDNKLRLLMRLVKDWGSFPKIASFHKLPHSILNRMLQLCLHENCQSELFNNGISYHSSGLDGLQTIMKGYNPKEYSEAIKAIKYDLESLKWDKEKRLNDELYTIAFKRSTTMTLNTLTPELVQNYADRYLYTSESVISVLGYDIQQKDLLKTTTKAVKDTDITRYYGGYKRIITDKAPIISHLSELNFNYFAVYFPIPCMCSKEMFSFVVLNHILGGGSSFSAGGPGKGIYSRLYQVLCKVRGIESINSHLLQFPKISLFGITMASEYNLNNQAFSIIFNQLMRLYDINNNELERAKNQSLSSHFQAMEQLDKKASYLGISMINCNKIYSNEEIEQHIRAVSKSDIQDMVKSMLNAPPTCVYVGNDHQIEDPKSLCLKVGIPMVE